MTASHEQQQLLQTVQKWFRHDEQISHYKNTLREGLSTAEKWLLSSIVPHQNIIDIGCGAGRVSAALAQEHITITAVDISYELLQLAQRHAQANNLHINFVQIDALRLPFLANTFDLALAIKVYCYIPSRTLRVQYIQEIVRVLQPGGILVMTQYITPAEWTSSAYDEHYHRIAPNYTTLEKGDAFAIIEEDQTYSYVHRFTEAELREELEQVGLSIIVDTNDKDHGGEGYIQLIALQKPT